MNTIDPWDLAQRNSRDIEDAFHESWFSPSTNDIAFFAAPVFYLADGIVRFINGRHRTLVLSKHLSELPMALGHMDGFPLWSSHPTRNSLDALARISVRRVYEGEEFRFPDLPVKYLGFDYNIGK